MAFGAVVLLGCSAGSDAHRTTTDHGLDAGTGGNVGGAGGAAGTIGQSGAGGTDATGGSSEIGASGGTTDVPDASSAVAGRGGASAAAAGGARPTLDGGTVTTGPDLSVNGKLVPNTPGLRSSPKLDLVIMVDNSRSMADKQDVLSRSIPDLVARIADPSSGITDLHVGVITSSIGGHGASNVCVGSDTSGNLEDQEADDHGHFVATRPRFDPGALPNALKPTPEGFLAWTPSMGTAGLQAGIQEMVTAAGELGCGLESQLEAAYRTLVDPHPYKAITTQPCAGTTATCAVATDVDTTLLAQRKAFLRPDSVVAVVLLTDENDCSIRDGGQYYYAAREDITLPHATAACDVNPNDRCCYSCTQSPPSGCTADPSCSTATTGTDDPLNLRCFHDMQRFGIDFLYPVDRYVAAFSRTELCTSRADLVPVVDCPDADGDGQPDLVHNPLFWDLTDPTKPVVRDPSMVYLLGIVGVPYQDLQQSASAGRIDYRTPDQLAAAKTWDVVLGNPAPGGNAAPVPPTDELMVESVAPRSGKDGETPPAPLVDPSGGYLANPVNGHEWTIAAKDDLQYACIFPLPAPRDCDKLRSTNPVASCDCLSTGSSTTNPVCQSADGTYSGVQTFAKAYPGLRELQVLQGLGQNGLAASICTRNSSDSSRQDYGYRPAIDLLTAQIRRSAL